MKLIVIILNRVELLEDLLSAFLEIGISGATVIDSMGMGQILTTQIPIFAGLREAFPGMSPVNKTIFVIVEEEQVTNVEFVLKDICGNFDKPGSGLYFVIPLDFVVGYRPGY
jgi:nitrogen regulatory protein P-II 1